MKIKNVEELEAWQQAHALTLLVYRLTKKFPREELFGLLSQLRRSSSGVAANIAQGYGRRTTKELLHSFRIANGEVEETRYFCRLSKDLNLISEEEFEEVKQRCGSVSRLLSALARSLKNSSPVVTSYQSPVTSKARSKV